MNEFVSTITDQPAESLTGNTAELPVEAFPTKVKPSHLSKLAIVYVRQSTPQQVLEHRESTARQYALVDRAAVLGWPREQILVIDDDLGLSGASSENRNGFQKLLAEISNGAGGPC